MKKPLVILLIAAMLLPVLCACQSLAVPESTESDTEAVSEQPDVTPMKQVEYYENPVMSAKTENAWQGYGFGDPFVMRHNGVYYLYVSTKDGEVGVKCWSSYDLVNWEYRGLCATDTRTRGAYAPEVYYYNGYFYMYTSPAGNGHYVLRSSSPTGEFEVVTENLGMSIDGSVFIDDDGKWYFYTANHGDMMVYSMSSPTRMHSGRTLKSISVNGAWTEGPMTVYHDGYYYMTYTGNHVLSRAYRIHYGVSTRSPIAFSGTAVENPILIHTMDDLFGIGHSSTVKGPDLDSYYIVYHSLVNSLPNRSMHVDRIDFNGESMQILGPHEGKAQVPSMPDIYHHFEGGASLSDWDLQGGFGKTGKGLPLAGDAKLLSKAQLTGDFTAEYTVTDMPTGTQAAALFAYADENNFGACYFDAKAQALRIEITVNGALTCEKVALPKSFGEDVRFDCVQSLQIERKGDTYTFYFNDRLLCEKTVDGLGAGAVGYATRGGEASFGFIGATGAVGGRGAADEFHSVGAYSGLIPAAHYASGAFDTVQTQGVNAVVAHAGSELDYYVLAQKSGAYDVSWYYASSEGATLEVLVDGEAVASVTLAESDTLTTAILRGVPMEKGQHMLSYRVVKGEVWLMQSTALCSVATPEKAWTFDAEDNMFMYSDGSWTVDGSLRTTSRVCAKRLYGSENWGDYTVEVSVTPTDGVNCGLLVRATNPGAPNFAHVAATDADAAGGTDWLQGYFVGLSERGVIIGKQNYSYQELARADGNYTKGTTYVLRVECEGATMRVFVDSELLIEYTDPDPFMQGMIGVRTCVCAAEFDELRVQPLQ